jgi:hypothetical protein
VKLPVVYLAGAIRPDHPEDAEWRLHWMSQLVGLAVVYNPMLGKEVHLGPDYQRNVIAGTWSLFGVPSDPALIVHHDFYMLDNADIIVFNLLAMGEGYPCLGSLMEFGRSTTRPQIRYAVLPPGHAVNTHPFIAHLAAHRFEDLEGALKFTRNVCAGLTATERAIKQVVQVAPQQDPPRIVVPPIARGGR